jgi:hypothetical protein
VPTGLGLDGHWIVQLKLPNDTVDECGLAETDSSSVFVVGDGNAEKSGFGGAEVRDA